MNDTSTTRRIKCLITGNTGAMFDVGGLPVKPAANSALSLELGFFSSTTAVRNLIYYTINNNEYDWINSGTVFSKNPDPSSRPSSSSVFGVFQLVKNGNVVFSKDLTFGDGDAYITVDEWTVEGKSHAVIDIPAGVLASGSYVARVQTFVRWFRAASGTPTWISGWAPEASSIDIELGSISVLPSEETDDVSVFQSIRVALDSLKFNNDATNILSGELLQFHSGNATKIEIGLFRNGAIPSDLLVNGARLEFSIKDTGMDWYPDIDSGVLLQKTISEIDASMTLADWEAGAKQHAILELTSDETSITTGVRWLCVDLVSGNSRVTFYSGRIYVVDNGVRGKNLTDILGEARAAAQEAIDARDATAAMREEQQNQSALLKGYNLSDLPDKAAARENLDVYSKPESDSALSTLAAVSAKQHALYVRRGSFQTAAGSFDTSAIKNVSIAIDFEIESLVNKAEDAPYALCLFSNVYRNGGLYLTILVSPDGSGKRLMYFGATYEAVAGTYSNKAYTLSENQLLGRHTLAICSGEHVPVGTGGYMDYRVFLDGAELPLTIGNQGFYFNETTANAGYFYFGGHSTSHSTLVPSRFKTCPWDMKLHRYKIFNYDIFGAGVPYSHDDFLSGKLVPPSLRNSANAQRILWEMADFTYPENSSTRLILDESGNGGNATITGDIAGDKDGASDVFISKLKEQISQLG